MTPMFTASKLKSIQPLLHDCSKSLTSYMDGFVNNEGGKTFSKKHLTIFSNV